MNCLAFYSKMAPVCATCRDARAYLCVRDERHAARVRGGGLEPRSTAAARAEWRGKRIRVPPPRAATSGVRVCTRRGALHDFAAELFVGWAKGAWPAIRLVLAAVRPRCAGGDGWGVFTLMEGYLLVSADKNLQRTGYPSAKGFWLKP